MKFHIPHQAGSNYRAIASIIKSGKIKDITDVRDETDLNGLKITIDIKRNSDPEDIMNKLYKLTPLEDSFSCNFNILINQNLYSESKAFWTIESCSAWIASEEIRI